MINIHISRTGNESSVSLLRRFQKKVQGSKIIIKAKSKRYSSRPLSKLKIKEETLNSLLKKKKTLKLIKLGKITPKYRVRT